MIGRDAWSQINIQWLQWYLIYGFLEKEDKNTLRGYLSKQHFNKSIFNKNSFSD